jgi:hypothetical protein
MAWARALPGYSDVYVYEGDGLVCSGCLLDGENHEYFTTAEMVAHLRQHEQAGHLVPSTLIPALLVGAESTDADLAEKAP